MNLRFTFSRFRSPRLKISLGIALWLGLVGIAVQAQSIALAPAQVIAEFQAGKPFSFELTVANKGPEEVEMRGSVSDFWYKENGEKLFATPGSMPRSAANWIEFVPRTFTVPANGSQKVRVTVTPPAGKIEGGHYAVLFVESKPRAATDENKKAVFVNLRLGALILLSAQHTESYDLRFTDAKLTPPDSSHNLQLECNFHNQSNTHVFPKIQLVVLSAQHELMGKAESENKRMLPGEKQTLSVSWPGTLAPGNYEAVLTVTYADHRLMTKEYSFSVKP
jgi:methionine-rich copper-binding protein CopC